LKLRAERLRPFGSIHHVSLLFLLAVALAFSRVPAASASHEAC
jgi:hypothetical protein